MNPFTSHPASVGETYGEHCVFAFGFGARMMLGGAAAMMSASVAASAFGADAGAPPAGAVTLFGSSPSPAISAITWLGFKTWLRPRISVVKPSRSVGSAVGVAGAPEADAAGEMRVEVGAAGGEAVRVVLVER